MVYSVGAAFKEFNTAISLDGDKREISSARRDEIVRLLEKELTLLDSFATGSIPKFTALNGSDLDLMTVLHFGKHIKDKKPSEVLQAVRDVLAGYRTNVRKNGQAVTLYYKTWPSVDIVPVSRTDNSDGTVNCYNVPDMNAETWIKSRPRRHATTISDMAKSYGSEFRAIIRMMKSWNNGHSQYLQSYHIEVLAVKLLSGVFSNYPWEIYQFFENAYSSVSAGDFGSSLWYEDAFVDAYLTYSDRQEAKKRLKTAKDLAKDAWSATSGDNPDQQKAIGLWQRIFGDKFPSYG